MVYLNTGVEIRLPYTRLLFYCIKKYLLSQLLYLKSFLKGSGDIARRLFGQNLKIKKMIIIVQILTRIKWRVNR